MSPSKNSIAKIVATFCYVGYFPVASATVGSAIGIAIYCLVKNNVVAYCVTIAALFLLGTISADIYEKNIGKKDPREVIIDEVASVFLVYLFIPFSLRNLVMGFFLFRLFDVIKPPPIRKLEKLPGGLGIMSDDIVAAFYANILLQILSAVLP